jgi:short subunit dehydrogenase-like uncharacterized protein
MGIVEGPSSETKKLMDPYYLLPNSISRDSLPAVRPFVFGYDKILKRWKTYFVMESANSATVRRSWALLQFAYGSRLTYNEAHSTFRTIFGAIAFAASLAFGGLAILIPPVRWLIKKLVPQGTGPSEKSMRTGHFTTKTVGVSEVGTVAIATIKGIQDPGYRETAKMLAESGLTLLLDKERLDRNDESLSSFGVLKGGVLTPATAMGYALVERLRGAGMGLEVEEVKDVTV